MRSIKVVASRKDGLGSRIIAIMHAFFLADKLNIDENSIRIIYGALRTYTRNKPGNFVIKDGNNIKLLGLAEADKEELFSEKFIEKYFIEPIPNGNLLSLDFKTYATFSCLIEDINKNDYDVIASPLIDFTRIIKIENIVEEYKRKMSFVFGKIEFAPKIQELIEKAKNKALEIGDFIAIHVRSGDSIYDYADFRKFNLQSVFHATCCELVLGLIEANKDKNIVLVGDDISSLEEISKVANHNNLFVLNSLHFAEMSNTESFIYDVIFMSKSSCLYGTNSAVVRMSNYIGNQDFINSYSVFNNEEYYKILKKYFDKLNVHPSQKAFSLFHLFLVSKKLSKSYQELIAYCEKALEYDPENDKYRIHKIDCLLNAGDRQEAENYLKEILDLRESEFIRTLLLKGWIGIVYAEVFNNYFKAASNDFPCLSYVASKIYSLQNNLELALKFAKLAYEAEPQNEIFKDHLLKLLLEQPTPQPKIITKEVVKQTPIPNIYLASAKDRIHNHLAYKLGQAMILNSKSLLGYIRMPYVLSFIKEAHQKEQKEYQAKTAKNPSLKLPKLESYPDYKEALKEKECFTYKLGEALIKANSVRGGGRIFAYLAFFQEVRRLKREFREKKK